MMKYKIIGGLILAAMVLLDIVIVRVPHWGFDGFGFFAGYGFISCVVLVLISKILGVWLKRRNTYYRD